MFSTLSVGERVTPPPQEKVGYNGLYLWMQQIFGRNTIPLQERVRILHRGGLGDTFSGVDEVSSYTFAFRATLERLHFPTKSQRKSSKKTIFNTEQPPLAADLSLQVQ